jgi:hypothetical protein
MSFHQYTSYTSEYNRRFIKRLYILVQDAIIVYNSHLSTPKWIYTKADVSELRVFVNNKKTKLPD